jgi:hypothetical protein
MRQSFEMEMGVQFGKNPMPPVILPAPVPARPRRFSAMVLSTV